MSVATAIKTLLASANISSVGTRRIFPDVVPINERDKYDYDQCALVYQIISITPNDTLAQGSPVDDVRVQISAYSSNNLVAETAIDAVRAFIDRYGPATVAGVDIMSISFLDYRSQFDEKGERVGLSHDYKFRIKRYGNPYTT